MRRHLVVAAIGVVVAVHRQDRLAGKLTGDLIRQKPHRLVDEGTVVGIRMMACCGVELAAAIIIGIAALEATIKALLLFAHRGAPPEAKNEVRLTLGRWLAVGLEFELAADILRTAITPTWTEIAQLAAIAALRTSLGAEA